jgi:DNA-directed RNA polymerase specialized sigma24 family protein
MREKSSRSSRARTRIVDFQDIEGNSEARLTSFQKDVLDKLRAGYGSPLDRLIAEEEEAAAEKNRAIQKLRQLRRYVKYARLTPKQRQAYELFFITKRPGMTLRKLARKLKISPSSAWARISGALLRLERVKLRRQEGEELRAILDGVLYAGKLKKVFRLYFEKGWPPQAVAQSLHSNLSTIYSNIHLIRDIAVDCSDGKYVPPKQARKKIYAPVEKTSNKEANPDQI